MDMQRKWSSGKIYDSKAHPIGHVLTFGRRFREFQSYRLGNTPAMLKLIVK